MHIQKNILLKDVTAYRIGGPADEFFIARSRQELRNAILHALDRGIPYFVLGAGANILVSDKGFRGLVIKNDYDDLYFKTFQSTETRYLHLLRAGSGATVQQAIEFSRDLELSGFEHFAGIPSTIGGALWQNLHFLNPARDGTAFIADIVHHAYVLDTRSGYESILFQEGFKFGYDTSILHSGRCIVLDAVFSLGKSSRTEIDARLESNLAWRNEKHPPLETLPSCGSVFKKTSYQGEIVAAAKLIDMAGLQGFSIGQAEVSTKHPNFIVNLGNASARDVLEIIRHVQAVVQGTFGVMLELEIGLIGEFDER